MQHGSGSLPVNSSERMSAWGRVALGSAALGLGGCLTLIVAGAVVVDVSGILESFCGLTVITWLLTLVAGIVAFRAGRRASSRPDCVAGAIALVVSLVIFILGLCVLLVVALMLAFAGAIARGTM